MKKYSLGIYEKALPTNIDWEERLTAAHQAGFDFLEISIDETEDRQSRLDWNADQREGIVQLMQMTKMPIRTMCLSAHRKFPLGSHDPLKRRKGMEIMEKAIELAYDLGIRIIQLAGYDVYYEEGDEKTRAYFLENMQKSVKMAATAGVLMGFETMETPLMDTISKAMRYVREIESPYLGIYPDLGNLTNAANLYGLSIHDEFEAGRGHIVAMHIKETRKNVYRNLHFGEGWVDFKNGIAEARSQGVNRFVAECWYDGRKNWQNGISEVNQIVRSYFA